jgi:hypothetical protein
MPHTLYVDRIPEQVVPGKRCGRNILFDSRSLAYPVIPADPAMLALKVWARNIAILDQGDIGDCVPNATTGACGTDPIWPALPAKHPTLDEAFAVRMYNDCENMDGDGPYPPNDNGSYGLTGCKVAKNDGLISGYLNAANVTAMATALQSGPVIIGINWYDSMDSPDSTGLITISPGAQVRGGHELVIRKVDPAAQLFGGDNSWGPSWGDAGSFSISFADMDRLFSEGGDCYAPLPLTAPAPVPVPTPVPPSPGPDAADTALWVAAAAWAVHWSAPGAIEELLSDLGTRLTHPHIISTRQAARDLEAWARAKGFPF